MLAYTFTDWIVNIDQQLFIFLNGLHCAFLDPVMVFLSKIGVWIPLYVGITFFIFWKRNWKIGLLTALGVILTFALTDALGVHLFKNVIERPRPCHEASLQSVIHLLEGCGGQFSFISNHAANTFGLAMFTSLFFCRKWYSIVIFSWAAIVSYSRIYVGKHYPFDIICGAAFGLLVGYSVFMLYQYAKRKLITESRT